MPNTRSRQSYGRHSKKGRYKCNFERVCSTVSDGLEKRRRLTRSSQKSLDPIAIKRSLLPRGFTGLNVNKFKYEWKYSNNRYLIKI
jgi:hypothetical protein